MSDIDQIAREAGIENLERLPRDVSPRQYFRGIKEGRSVVVMVYPDTTEKNLAELEAFVRIDGWLRRIGLSAPEIYAVDDGRGFAVLEDLGGVSFGRALREGGDRNALYTLGCDVLKELKNAQTIVKGLPLFWNSRIHQNRSQIIEYYAPLKVKKQNINSELHSYFEVLDVIEKGLPSCPQGFVHGDFHLENLMWQSEGEGLTRCGIIDFQDALLGPLPYDLVNLLEDARVDVPTDLRAAMLDRYCEGMSAEQKQTFKAWYRFLGTQFHCRVIGLFIKLAVEQGRDQYLIHIPRLQRYIEEGLKDPIMGPLKVFFEKEKIDFSSLEDMNGERIRALFRDISS